jgi:hypothetical protein
MSDDLLNKILNAAKGQQDPQTNEVSTVQTARKWLQENKGEKDNWFLLPPDVARLLKNKGVRIK